VIYLYSSGNELLKLAEGRKISEVVIDYESKFKEMDINSVRNNMRNVLKVMKESSHRALGEEIKSIGGLIGGDAKKVNIYSEGKTISGATINKAMARAFSSSEVNASMGLVCAAPTAGSCGILPAAIFTVGEELNLSEEIMINGLFTASGIGTIIAKNATLSGAEGGCQAECGSAAAMAAAAIVEMAGGSSEMSLFASAIALKNVMGLICDPVGGLVEAPCAKRNASGVVNALISADLALAGVKSIIPFDEVVKAMYKVGRLLPLPLKETAQGGIADTKTGKRLKRQILM
jgi:L-serine dehydratase